ncbi:TIGR02677 family protein [Kribbella sp. NPDC026611]|uniref:TIGR02677 family protein n=1 Tax=Kribbella sp. NPDC026611 TaxID=3154911 RepID=UPI00340ECA60
MDPIRIPPELFRFTWGDRAELYVAILHAFTEANERLDTTLGIDDLTAWLRSIGWVAPSSEEQLRSALEQLRAWQLVDFIQDHTENYRTALEYERNNVRYSLSRRGEAAYAGVTHAMTVLVSTGALQTAVLDAIGDRLADLVVELDGGSDRKVFTALMELEGHLEALRGNTKQFNGELQRLLRVEGVDLATFHDVKVSTVAYLEEFLTNLDHRAHVIRTRIEAVLDRGVAWMQRRALTGAELPQLTGVDPGPAWLERRQARWEGLLAWFVGTDVAPPRVEQLHTVGRKAIVTLLQVLDRITETRRRASSAVADFRELARWFTVVPAQDDLHRLGATAFGLASARHAHLAIDDPELIASSTSWWDAPPVAVSPLLRSSGRTEKFSRTGRVRDVAALKAARAERAAAERTELEAAWSLLDTGGPVRLSGLAALDDRLFERLRELLGQALTSAPARSGHRRAATSDGQAEILLWLPSDGAVATIRTPQGVFRGPDYVVEIRANRSRASRESEGSG